MRIARLETADGPQDAVWTGDAWALVEDGSAERPVHTGVSVPAAEARLLAPCEPQVLVGIAHNKTNPFNRGNREHPLPIQAWHKSVRSVVGPGEAIHARRGVGTVNIEGELAVVISRETEGLTLENAFDYVLGYTVVNDVTNPDRNAVDEKTFQGKGGYGYTPLGPWIETELDDPEHVATTVIINGVVRAESGSFNLPSTVAESIVYVAQWIPLGRGDVIMSGAPSTSVAVNPGDTVEITLAGIGTLTNPVV
ncbi:fumarylacetoacetate hydrolase family protein [uncultured Friedmanniella sp.]|uniref:fumarylacetoacetate hydrolase family protein n=1 Tax=uncultured Friedmanniella sp. TaxID=335381 RepID=UPI0035CB1508